MRRTLLRMLTLAASRDFSSSATRRRVEAFARSRKGSDLELLRRNDASMKPAIRSRRKRVGSSSRW